MYVYIYIYIYYRYIYTYTYDICTYVHTLYKEPHARRLRPLDLGTGEVRQDAAHLGSRTNTYVLYYRIYVYINVCLIHKYLCISIVSYSIMQDLAHEDSALMGPPPPVRACSRTGPASPALSPVLQGSP